MGLRVYRVSDLHIGWAGGHNVPYYVLELVLSDIRRNLGFYLARAQGHGERRSHVILYGCRNLGVPLCWAEPDFCRALVLELALSKLNQVGPSHQGQDDIGRVPFLDCSFQANCVCGVDEDTGVVGDDDGVDHGGQVIDVGECFDAEHNIIECSFSAA